MTQEPGYRHSPTHKRSSRSVKHRPVLVTSVENEGRQQQEISSHVEENSVESIDTLEQPPVVPATSRIRRLPSFFSTVGKGEKTDTMERPNTAQARIARALRGKSTTSVTPESADTDEKKVSTKPEPRRVPTKSVTTPARPASPFKTRYLIGMMIYLLVAEFVGSFEAGLLKANHLDVVLTTFNLFGAPIVVSTSTLVFLATLIILLVALARFDLLPRSFSSMGGQPASKRTSGHNTSSTNGRSVLPTTRQGVKGEDDDLYQSYRDNQRRAKKK